MIYAGMTVGFATFFGGVAMLMNGQYTVGFLSLIATIVVGILVKTKYGSRRTRSIKATSMQYAHYDKGNKKKKKNGNMDCACDAMECGCDALD